MFLIISSVFPQSLYMAIETNDCIMSVLLWCSYPSSSNVVYALR